MNNNNLVDLLTQTRNYEAHRKKIASIMTKNNQTIDNRRIGVMNAFYSNHGRAQSYNYRVKQEAVEKENDLILKKIIKVNNRKPSNQNGQKTSSHNNLINMKKSLQSINHENQKLAQKLVSTTSNLRQEKLLTSYHKHLERKERIKKYEYDEEVGLVIPKKMKSMQKMQLLPYMKQGEDRYGYTTRERNEEEEEDQ